MAIEFDLDKIDFGAGPELDTPPKKPPVKSPPSKAGPGRPSKNSKLAELQTEIEGLVRLALLPVLMRDVHWIIDEHGNQTGDWYSCANVYMEIDIQSGPVLTREGKEFCAAATAIVIETPFLLKMITMGDEAGKYLRLLLATQPLAMAVFSNHIRGGKSEPRENQMAGAGT